MARSSLRAEEEAASWKLVDGSQGPSCSLRRRGSFAGHQSLESLNRCLKSEQHFQRQELLCLNAASAKSDAPDTGLCDTRLVTSRCSLLKQNVCQGRMPTEEESLFHLPLSSLSSLGFRLPAVGDSVPCAPAILLPSVFAWRRLFSAAATRPMHKVQEAARCHPTPVRAPEGPPFHVQSGTEVGLFPQL